MLSRSPEALIEIQAPAKVNLFLEVFPRRADGFHEIETLMVPVGIYDTVGCHRREDGQLVVRCCWTTGRVAEGRADQRGSSRGARGLRWGSSRGARGLRWEALPQGEENLVYRALDRLRSRSGTGAGAEIGIWKRIPAAAGLGGASSDAAAALLAANRLWGLDWPRAKLAEIAAEVGSDVPFFLFGSPAVCRGRGERIEPVNGLARLWLVVVRPPEGLSTAKVYGGCQPAGGAEAGSGSTGSAARSAADILAAARRGDAAAVGRGLFNRLQPAAEALSPWIERLRSAFQEADCLGHQMSGSGSSYFGLCRHAGHARQVAGRLRAADLGAVFVTATLGAGLAPGADPFKEERHADHRGSHQAHGQDR